SLGPAQTYQKEYFLDYPPGYLYLLWIAGTVAQITNAGGDALRLIAESPAIIADAFLALTIFAFVRSSQRYALAFAAMMMIALNPAMLFDTVVWGQSDSVLTFIMWLAAISILDGQFELCWALVAMSVLVKPQGLMMAPVFAWWTVLESDPWRWVRS